MRLPDVIWPDLYAYFAYITLQIHVFRNVKYLIYAHYAYQAGKEQGELPGKAPKANLNKKKHCLLAGATQMLSEIVELSERATAAL